MSAKCSVEVNGVHLETQCWPGKRKPILMLHEGLGSISMWRDFPAALAAASGHEVIAWSRQGYGASDRLPERRDPGYMHREADALPALLDAVGVDQAYLLGHSDGGSIALIAAARSPERVTGLILMAPHVYVEPLTVDSITAAKIAYETTDLGLKLARHHDDADHVFWHWNDIWLDPRFRAWNIEAMLSAIRAPALMIQGLDDEYGTMDHLDRIEAVLRDTRRLELSNCGHSPHRDQPAAVLAASVSFLNGTDP